MKISALKTKLTLLIVIPAKAGIQKQNRSANWRMTMNILRNMKLKIESLKHSLEIGNRKLKIAFNGFSRRLISSVVAFLILTPLIFLIFRPSSASAAWFDDNYAYRQKFSFTHNADISSAQRITITIDTASLITAGIMRSDCNDTRFTDINGKLLRYQLTGTCNNASTTYDIEFLSISNGANTGYFYYGNPTAISKSDPSVNQVTALTPSGGAPSLTNRSAEEKGPTPVLSWNLSEGFGTTAYDSSQFTNNGTLTSGPTWQNKDLCLQNGNCLQFDGSNDNVQKTYSSDKELDIGTASMSASLWYKHPNTISATQYLISRYTTTSPAGGYKVYMKSTGVVCFAIDDDSTWTPDDETCDTTSTANSKWHFLSAVKSEGSASITIYVDGKQVGQKTSLSATGSISGNSPTFYVGIDSDGSSSPWNGFISRVKIYNFARTSSQIQSDFANIGSQDTVSAAIGSGDPSSSLNQGLVGYWKMDDGLNNACSAGVDKACDNSGNANTGTWTSGVASTSGKFGNATNYNGVNSYTSVANTVSSIQTIAFWVNPASSSASLIQLATGVDIKATTGTVTTDNITSPTIYVNGILNGAFTAKTWNHVVVTTSTAVSASSIQFGKMQTGVLNGQLDDTRFYSRTLSPSEISRLYDWGPGPVGWWKFDERTGTTANDTSGNANNGTLTNNPQWTTGKIGSGLSFDGVSSYVDAGNGASLKITGSRSVSAWVYIKSFNAGANENIVAKELDGTNKGWNFVVTNDNAVEQLLLYLTSDGSTNSGRYSNTTLKLNQWYHFVGVYNALAQTADVYINGAKDNGTLLGTIPSSTFDPITNLNIGAIRAGSVSYINGLIDDVRIYNYALTPKQIVSVMNADHPAVGSPVGSAVGYWKMDDGFAKTASNSGAAATALDATLLGAVPPTWKNHGKFGKSLNFSGSSGYLKVGNDTSSQITGDLTLSSWVYLSSTTTNEDIISKRGPPGQWAYRLWVDNTATPKIDIVDPFNTMATASASTTLSANQWYHLVGTYSASQSAVTIYVNGLQKGQTTSGIPNSIKNSTGDLDIGAENFGNTNLFNGNIDETKLYSYALSPDEVKLEYNHGSSIVLGSFSTDANGNASNSAQSIYCPPGDSSGNCAAGSDPSPVGEWLFNERSGTTAYDTSGNANTGTLTNRPQWTTGKLGQALSFNGSSTYIDLGTPASLGNLTARTISFWMYPKTLGGNSFGTSFISGPNTGVYSYISLCNSDAVECPSTPSTFVFFIKGSSTNGEWYAPANTVKLNQWQHIAITYNCGTDSNTPIFYYNGQQVTAAVSKTLSGVVCDDSAQTKSIGNDPPGLDSGFNGSLDDVRIYNYARTQAQVAWDYNRGGPVGWWKLDECTGTTAHDSSGQGNNGTITTGASGSQTTAGACANVDTAAAWYNGRTGKFNSSLNFDGTDDRIDIGGTRQYAITTSPFTMSAWFFLNSSSLGNFPDLIVLRTDTASGLHFLFSNNASYLGFSMGSNTSWATIKTGDDPATLTNAWHHIAVTYNGQGATTNANFTVFIDGQVHAISTAGAYGSSGVQGTTIGEAADGGNSFKGQIDDVRLYNYALTAPQIRTVYNEGSAVRFGPLTGPP